MHICRLQAMQHSTRESWRNDMSQELKKSLQLRHLTMIAFGGSIGAGLFVGSGALILSLLALLPLSPP